MKKEREVSENGNKVLMKGPKLGVVIVIGVLLAILLGMQVYASTNGYGNVFFMLKTLATGEAHGEADIFYDKEITLSNKSFEVTTGVKMQINKLQIKENESTLCLLVKATDETALPLKYELMSEGLTKTGVKSSDTKKQGEFTEELTVKYKFSDDELLTLFIKDKDGKLLKEVEINLGTREIIVKGESEVSKISQIELKKYLNVFSELNSEFATEIDRVIMVADDLDTKISNVHYTSTEDINTTIKEFYGDKIKFVKTMDKSGKELEIVDLKDSKAFEYNKDENIYAALTDNVDFRNGICLKIEDIDYKDGIYTVKYIYTLARYAEIDEEKIEELPQYETTIKLKRNEDAKYSKYQIVEIEKGKEVKDKVSVDLNENSESQTIEGKFAREDVDVWYMFEGNKVKVFAGDIRSGIYTTDGNTINITLTQYSDIYGEKIESITPAQKIELTIVDKDTIKDEYATYKRYEDEEDSICEHNYEVVLNSGTKADDGLDKKYSMHTTLDGTHIEKCSICGEERRVPHNFGKWFTIKSAIGMEDAYTLWCEDCKDYIYTRDYDLVKNSGYGMHEESNDESQDSFSVEAKQAIETYFELLSKSQTDPHQFIFDLGLKGEMDGAAAGTVMYNISFEDYKNIMLNYVTETIFEQKFASYAVKDFDGRIGCINPLDQIEYTIVGDIDEAIKEEPYSFTFKVKVDNKTEGETKTENVILYLIRNENGNLVVSGVSI